MRSAVYICLFDNIKLPFKCPYYQVIGTCALARGKRRFARANARAFPSLLLFNNAVRLFKASHPFKRFKLNPYSTYILLNRYGLFTRQFQRPLNLLKLFLCRNDFLESIESISYSTSLDKKT